MMIDGQKSEDRWALWVGRSGLNFWFCYNFYDNIHVHIVNLSSVPFVYLDIGLYGDRGQLAFFLVSGFLLIYFCLHFFVNNSSHEVFQLWTLWTFLWTAFAPAWCVYALVQIVIRTGSILLSTKTDINDLKVMFVCSLLNLNQILLQ